MYLAIVTRPFLLQGEGYSVGLSLLLLRPVDLVDTVDDGLTYVSRHLGEALVDHVVELPLVDRTASHSLYTSLALSKASLARSRWLSSSMTCSAAFSRSRHLVYSSPLGVTMTFRTPMSGISTRPCFRRTTSRVPFSSRRQPHPLSDMSE